MRNGALTCKGFASAHTLLGLGDPRGDDRKKNDLRFADESMRWSGRQYEKPFGSD